MDTVLINSTDAISASSLEQSLPAGTYRVQLETTVPLDLNTVRAQLTANQIQPINITSYHNNNGNWVTEIDYERKAQEVPLYVAMSTTSGQISQFALLAIIPVIVPLAVAALVGISIFKIGSITTDLVKVLVVCGGVFVLALAILGSGSVKAGSFELKKG